LSTAEGFDLGSGNGRIARIIAPRVGILNCVEPSAAGIAAARSSLAGLDNVRFHRATVDAIPLPEESQDFGYSIGVLHHIPSPLDGLRACVRKLKPGAPFLLYVYHDVSFRPPWVRASWRLSNVVRKGVSRLPFGMKVAASNLLAATLYWPLSRTAALLERLGRPVEHLPLAYYRAHGWDVLKADALDRFGTPVEHRFSRDGVIKLMKDAGLQQVRVADGPPYWVAAGIKP
jgi:SAM-dependent methyltransferase